MFSFTFPGFLPPLYFIAAFCSVHSGCSLLFFLAGLYVRLSRGSFIIIIMCCFIVLRYSLLLLPCSYFPGTYYWIKVLFTFPYSCHAPSSNSGVCVSILLSGVFLVYLLLMRMPSVPVGFPSLLLLVLFLFLLWFTRVLFTWRLLFSRFFLRYRCSPTWSGTLASVPVSYPLSFLSPCGVRRFRLACMGLPPLFLHFFYMGIFLGFPSSFR